MASLPPLEWLPRGPATFQNLPVELHREIADHLPASAMKVMATTLDATNLGLYKKPTSLTPIEDAMAQELLTRDDFEAIIKPHIAKHGQLIKKKLSESDREKLAQTKLFCRLCAKAHSWEDFHPEDIRLSLQYEGVDNMQNRDCLGTELAVVLGHGNGQRVYWDNIEKGVEKMATWPDTITAITTPLVLRTAGRKPKRRSHLTMTRPDSNEHAPKPELNLSKHVEGGQPRYEVFASTPTRLMTYRAHSGRTANIYRLRVALATKRPIICPHMTASDILLNDDEDPMTGKPSSLLQEIITSLHDGLVWEDTTDDTGTVIKQRKCFVGECPCYDDGCRTHFVFERMRCKVRWGWGEESLWLRVQRTWEVDTPGGKEWRFQIGLEGSRFE